MSSRKKLAPKTKPAKPKAEPPVIEAEETYSISKLAEYYGVDRSVMATKLNRASFEPVINEPRRKEYRLEDVEPLVEAEQNREEVKLRQMTAEMRLKELELAEDEGSLMPRREVEDHLQKLFTAMFQRLAVRLPKEIKGQLNKASNEAQIASILQTSISGIFNELRRDHTKFLPRDSAGDS